MQWQTSRVLEQLRSVIVTHNAVQQCINNDNGSHSMVSDKTRPDTLVACGFFHNAVFEYSCQCNASDEEMNVKAGHELSIVQNEVLHVIELHGHQHQPPVSEAPKQDPEITSQ